MPTKQFLFCLSKLPALEKLMKSEHQTILTPLVSLDTPGKATVQVVIIADPVRTVHQFLLYLN